MTTRGCLAAMQAAGYQGYINIEYENNKYSADEATSPRREIPA